MSVNLYACRYDAVVSETRKVSILDIYLGLRPPELVDLALELYTFAENEDLFNFLRENQVDQIWLFRGDACPKQYADYLVSWMEKNLLKQLVIEEEIDVGIV